jgi:hypothetical protein
MSQEEFAGFAVVRKTVRQVGIALPEVLFPPFSNKQKSCGFVGRFVFFVPFSIKQTRSRSQEMSRYISKIQPVS